MWGILDLALVYYRQKSEFKNKKKTRLLEIENVPIAHMDQDLSDKQDLRHVYVH